MNDRRRRARGQTLVEFALVFPVFVLVLFGLIDVGRLVYANSVLSQAAREVVRVGAVEAGWIGNPNNDPSCNQPGGPVCAATAEALQSDVATAANRMVAGTGTITNVYVSCTAPGSAPTGAWTTGGCDPSNGQNTTGYLISVRVVFIFTPITPVIAQLVQTVTLSGSATMVID